IEVAIAVHVGEHGAGGMPPRQGYAGLGGDVGEAPVPEVLVQHVGAEAARQIDVGTAVAVHVADRDPPGLGVVTIPQRAVERNYVGKRDPNTRGSQLLETRPTAVGNVQIPPTIPRCAVPRRDAWDGMA